MQRVGLRGHPMKSVSLEKQFPEAVPVKKKKNARVIFQLSRLKNVFFKRQEILLRFDSY